MKSADDATTLREYFDFLNEIKGRIIRELDEYAWEFCDFTMMRADEDLPDGGEEYIFGAIPNDQADIEEDYQDEINISAYLYEDGTLTLGKMKDGQDRPLNGFHLMGELCRSAVIYRAEKTTKDTPKPKPIISFGK